MFHLGGFGESVDAAGALTNIQALLDTQLSRSGDQLRTPMLTTVLMLAAGVGSGGDGYAQLVAPILREFGSMIIQPCNGNSDGDAEPNDPPNILDLRNRPLTLRASENISAQVESDTTSAAFQWLLAIFSDGMTQAPTGPVRSHRFSNASTLTVDVWNEVEMTALDELPAGEYSVIGMHAVSAGLVAARIIPRGGNGWRPGCIGGDVDDYQDHPMFRYGGLGEWMRFLHDDVPNMEFLSVSADTDQQVILDLVRV